MALIEITTAEQLVTTIKQQPNIILDVYATWCGPCKMIAPHYKNFSEKYTHVTFLKMDADEVPEFDVESLPSFFLYKNGELAKQVSGGKVENIEKAIVEVFGEPSTSA